MATDLIDNYLFKNNLIELVNRLSTSVSFNSRLNVSGVLNCSIS